MTRILACVFTVRGTKKLLDRVPGPVVPAAALQPSTTILGAWYVTVLFWQPQVALFVNEPTRLPLLVPLAPGTSVIARMPQTAATVFADLGIDEQLIDRELTEMSTHQLTKTASRSVLGTMNDFAYLADAHRGPDQSTDLIELSLRLARTPCGPLYRSQVSPDREIIAYLDQHTR
jgi:hypothetical protein